MLRRRRCCRPVASCLIHIDLFPNSALRVGKGLERVTPARMISALSPLKANRRTERCSISLSIAAAKLRQRAEARCSSNAASSSPISYRTKRCGSFGQNVEASATPFAVERSLRVDGDQITEARDERRLHEEFNVHDYLMTPPSRRIRTSNRAFGERMLSDTSGLSTGDSTQAIGRVGHPKRPQLCT